MSARSRKRVLTGFAFLFGIACGVGIGTMHLGPNEPAPEVVTEHRALDGGTPTRHLGEDCTTHGRADCISAVCLHAKPDRARGFFCSRRCNRRIDCPVGWHCPQIYPGPQGHFCVPPSSWTAHVGYYRDGGTL